MDVTKVRGLGDSALLDNVVTPQQDRQSASNLQGCSGAGAGHLAPSTPRNAQKKSGGIKNGGACNAGGGGAVGNGGQVAQSGKVRKGKGGVACVPWTDDERIALFESYLRSGGVKDGGYIKKTKALYDQLGLAPRSAPSLTTQLKRIEQGALSKFQRDEIAKRVRLESSVRRSALVRD